MVMVKMLSNGIKHSSYQTKYTTIFCLPEQFGMAKELKSIIDEGYGINCYIAQVISGIETNGGPVYSAPPPKIKDSALSLAMKTGWTKLSPKGFLKNSQDFYKYTPVWNFGPISNSTTPLMRFNKNDIFDPEGYLLKNNIKPYNAGRSGFTDPRLLPTTRSPDEIEMYWKRALNNEISYGIEHSPFRKINGKRVYYNNDVIAIEYNDWRNVVRFANRRYWIDTSINSQGRNQMPVGIIIVLGNDR